MPFLALYVRELGVTRDADVALWTGLALGVDAGDYGAVCALLGPRRRSLRQQDPGAALASQLRAGDGGDGLRHAARGTWSRCGRCRGWSPAMAG